VNISDLKFIEIQDKNDPYWIDCLDYIRKNCSNDPLYENYISINPKYYLYFNAVLYQNRIISFGAIELSHVRWGAGIARVLTRFWIHPEHRSESLTKWSSTSIRFSPLILEKQIEFLKSQKHINAAMITREGNYRKSFEKIVFLANTVKEINFEILPSRYNVCGVLKNPPSSCSQMIALASLKDRSINDLLKESQSKGLLLEVS
jgi:hypothetical protein